MKFRVEYQPKGRPQVVFARRLEAGDFAVPSGTFLGGAALSPGVTQPRALLRDGSPDLDLFAFQLKRPAEIALLPVGKIVELTSGSDGFRSITPTAATVVARFAGPDVRSILVERNPTDGYNLCLSVAPSSAAEAVVLRLIGVRSLPDLKEFMDAVTVALHDEGADQREFGRFRVEYVGEVFHEMLCDGFTVEPGR